MLRALFIYFFALRGKLPCGSKGKKQGEWFFFSAWGVISETGWCSEEHSRPKKAGRESKRNSSLPPYTLSISNSLRNWKQLYSSMWTMHLSSALSKRQQVWIREPSVGVTLCLFAVLAACCHMYHVLLSKHCDVWCGDVNSYAESKRSCFKDRCEPGRKERHFPSVLQLPGVSCL